MPQINKLPSPRTEKHTELLNYPDSFLSVRFEFLDILHTSRLCERLMRGHELFAPAMLKEGIVYQELMQSGGQID